MTTKALQVENLVKTYSSQGLGSGPRSPEVTALAGVDFTIEPGEIFGLLGPNGAGKTSLISILTTLEKATSGTARIFGYDVSQDPQSAKRQLGVVAQEIVNHGFFTVSEILRFHSGYYGIWQNSERIEELLQALDLWEHRHKLVKQLSGGMKRRLMIAKALVHRPKLLLLDEPTAGVDVELREKLWLFVRELQKQGTTVLLTTHYLEEAEELCGRVGILRRGHLEYLGPTRGIIEKLTLRQLTLILASWRLTAENEARAKATLQRQNPDIASGFQVAQKGPELMVTCSHALSFSDVIQALEIPIQDILDVRTREGSLEEAFRVVLEGRQ